MSVHERFDFGAPPPVEQHLPGPLDRGVADLDDALPRHRGEEADVDGVADVDVVGETSGEVEPGDVAGIDSESAQGDELPAVVGRLGLREVAGVVAREGDAVLGNQGHLPLLPVPEDPHFRHPSAAPQLGEEIDQAGAADPLRRQPADRRVLELPAAVRGEAQRFDRPLVPRHAELHEAPLEGGAGRAGGGQHAAPPGDDDLGVGADVDDHGGLVGVAVEAAGGDGRGRIGADVAGDQRHAVDLGAQVGAQSEAAGVLDQGGGRPVALEVLVLDQRFVRLLPDALHVELEQQVAHGRVAGDDDLVDLLPGEPEAPSQLEDLVADRVGQGPLQLSPEFAAVVGNAVHDVAAAEALGILEGADRDRRSRLQVDQLHHHRGGAEVDRQPVEVPAVGVDRLAVVEHAAAPARHYRVEGDLLFDARGQDLRGPPQRCELDVDVVAENLGLAGEAVVVAQEGFRLRRRRQGLDAAPDLDHALVAVAGPVAGGGHLHGELIGVVEDRPAGGELGPHLVVDHRGHVTRSGDGLRPCP